MSIFRNKTYCTYGQYELEILKNSNGTFSLISRNNVQPDATFETHPTDHSIFIKKVEPNELNNAFDVSTWAEYEGHIWHAEKINDGKIRLWTDQNIPVSGIKMIDRHWYEIWVNKQDISRVWEKREKSHLNLPFPEQVLPVLDIQF